MSDNLNTRLRGVKQELADFTEEFGLSLSNLNEDIDAKFSDISNQFD